MPYAVRLNTQRSIASTDAQQLIIELDLLRAELDDIRTQYAVVLAQLDSDAGVSGTTFAANGALATAQFTKL